MSNEPIGPNPPPAKSKAGQTDRKNARHETTLGEPHPQGGSTRPGKTGSLHLRCPHCNNPFVLADAESVADVECPVCRSHFSLVSGEETTTFHAGGTKVVGNFELIERVGVGHYGSVWKARDTELDRIVAVKIPHKGRLDTAETEQFVREARAAAQIRHGNIVSVHEVGRDGDSIYIVADYVEGATLGDWLTSQRLTPTEAARLCLKIAEALDAAHEASVVHRDLKPGNIMVDLAGEPHITDFGLAKRETGEVTMTVDGQVLGTPAYMSPEQARGEGHRADRRSDLYSLGVILYELLTGERPFRGVPRMLIVQVLRDEPASPRKLNSRIPRDLETVCLRCMDKDPNRRYQTARELADDLERFLNGEPVRVRPVGTLGRMWRWYRRHPDATVLAAGGYATLCAILFAIWSLAGLCSYALGVHPVGNLSQAVLDSVGFVIFFCFPMLWAGIRTLNQRTIGLWLGMLLSFVALLLSLAGLTGIMFDAGVFGDPAARAPLFVLFVLVSLIGVTLHVVAVIARLTTGGRD